MILLISLQELARLVCNSRHCFLRCYYFRIYMSRIQTAKSFSMAAFMEARQYCTQKQINPVSMQPVYSHWHPRPPPFQRKCQVGAQLLGKLMIKTEENSTLQRLFWQIPIVWGGVQHGENDHVYSQAKQAFVLFLSQQVLDGVSIME